MKIIDFALHQLVALIFKLEYQVPYKTADNEEKIQNFVLGECLYIPQLTDNHQNTVTAPIELDFMMGPGVSLTGEIMWD